MMIEIMETDRTPRIRPLIRLLDYLGFETLNFKFCDLKL